ncbi:MAG: GTP-binding protein [Ruminococcaceae bacterium]|nr:GTP-binding protein [Oscillospiraceae bacterium]
MKKLTLGILAHVDSGKTTLSEALLYKSNIIREMGRVDKRNTFFDTDTIERERGITVFSKQAKLTLNDMTVYLIDTPGHSDFGAETERTLCILDYAILLVSASDMVTGHTETLWRLLHRHNIPTFVFVNKTDLPYKGKDALFDDFKKNFGDGFFQWEDKGNINFEELAICDEGAMEEYLETDSLCDDTLISLFHQRKIFPVVFGSALKNQGIDELLECLGEYSRNRIYPEDFGARVYKISEDETGNRLTFLKVTGGRISVRDMVSGLNDDGDKWEEKINQIRIYSGEKFVTTDTAYAGDVCAFTGLKSTYSGQGLGFEEDNEPPVLESLFSYKVQLIGDYDMLYVLDSFKKLSYEDSQLKYRYNSQSGEIYINIMGEVQLEVLKRMIKDRFGMELDFCEAGVVYKETISDEVEGVGHFEPLRHYAEVHLLLEPLERGAGLKFESKCPDDVLDRHFQRLILTHLQEKTHLGVLTASPITDMKITLYTGAYHKKHTEGGDFRQATYRAVRQGLRKANSVLLEPWYDFSLKLPSENSGRAMTDLSNMGADINMPEIVGDTAHLTGFAPAKKIRSYMREITGYTKGMGRLSLSFSGYRECEDQDEIVREIGYDPEYDTENTADSVFCSHGAGFVVKWDKVEEYMHLESIFDIREKQQEVSVNIRKTNLSDTVENEAEIMKIFENTYGKIKKKTDGVKIEKKKHTGITQPVFKGKVKKYEGEYLLIDGYNIIFAWNDLKEAAKESLELARKKLIDRISNVAAVKSEKVIVVFDAYKVKGGKGAVDQEGNVTVVYTKEAETADTYIEKVSHKLSKNNLVRVATSDSMEQIIIIGSGAFRVSAENFLKEVELLEKEIEQFVDTE